MTIPRLQSNGELPPGEHQTTLDEIEVVFGSSCVRRKRLMQGLRDEVVNLELSNVETVWIDGSFVTSKVEPNDIDGCWEYIQLVDLSKLDPVFLANRNAVKQKFGLDFFISNIIEAGSGLPFPKFFQINRDGNSKGILVLKLGVSI